MTLRKKYSKIRKCVIYEIVCNITGERYIGSTISRSRKTNHKGIYNSTSSKQIISRKNYQYNKLEIFYCRYELSLLLKEQYYLDNLSNINQQRAITLKKHRKIEQANSRKRNMSIKYLCKCGRKVRKDSKWRHEKSKIHKKYIDNIINE